MGYHYSLEHKDPQLTGIPFNDAYRYMDWLLTVPMLLMEIVLVMKLSSQEATAKCCTLGVSSAAMIILGYPGELIVEGDLSSRWLFWFLAMLPFCYIVQHAAFSDGLWDAPSRQGLRGEVFCRHCRHFFLASPVGCRFVKRSTWSAPHTSNS